MITFCCYCVETGWNRSSWILNFVDCLHDTTVVCENTLLTVHRLSVNWSNRERWTKNHMPFHDEKKLWTAIVEHIEKYCLRRKKIFFVLDFLFAWSDTSICICQATKRIFSDWAKLTVFTKTHFYFECFCYFPFISFSFSSEINKGPYTV